jgi:glycosyltransferase involved in cell wall biosynthesis
VKILFILPTFYPFFQFGGVATSMYELIDELSKNKDIDISVFTLNHHDNVDKNIEVKKMKDNFIIKYFEKTSFFSNYSKYMVSEIKNIEIDVVYISAVWQIISIPITFLLIKKNIPYIFAPHGSFIYRNVTETNFFIKKMYFNLFIKKMLVNASQIQYVTKYEHIESEKFIGNSFNDIFYMPNILKQNNKSIYKDKDENKLIFIGRPDPVKNIEFMIECFLEALKINDKLELYIICERDDYLINIENTYKHNSIIFKGYLSREKVQDELNSSSVLLLFSKAENFSMTVLEAINNDVYPVISLELGISDYFVDYLGGLIDINDDKKMIARIIASSILKCKTNSFCNAKKEFMLKLNPQNIVNKFVNELNKAIINEK